MVRTKKKKPAIRFEIGWSGLSAIAVVCFCIFLWMFLLGVWTGQTLLEPGDSNGNGLKEFATLFWQKNTAVKSLPSNGVEKKQKAKTQKKYIVPLSREDSVFSLQVAAFRESDKARKVVLQWRARDYDAFYLAPERPNGTFYRVFIGSYSDISGAKKIATKLTNTEKNKYFITLIPSKEKRFP